LKLPFFPFRKRKYVVANYTQKQSSNGGLGDRIVGLVSAILLAEKTGRELKVCWQFPDISEVVNIPKKYLLSEKWKNRIKEKKPDADIRRIDTVDQQSKYKDILIRDKLHLVWPESVWVCHANQNFIQYLYKNPHYARVCGDYKSDLLRAYRSIFDEYLLYSNNHIPNSSTKLIGIQIRMGDHYMGVGTHRPVTDLSQAELYLRNIRKSVSTMNIDPHTADVFVTSDNKEVHPIARDVFSEFNVVGDTLGITHIDRQPETQKLEHLFRDFTMLCKADHLFFSLWSNFGRVSALMNKHQAYAFNLEGEISPVDWRTLSSKHEILEDI
jgi:hypothetical protein